MAYDSPNAQVRREHCCPPTTAGAPLAWMKSHLRSAIAAEQERKAAAAAKAPA